MSAVDASALDENPETNSKLEMNMETESMIGRYNLDERSFMVARQVLSRVLSIPTYLVSGVS